MGVKVTVPTLGAVDNSSFVTELNNTLDVLGDEFDKVVYLDGSTGLTGNLDMGSNRIYNLGAPVDPNDAVRLQDMSNGITVTVPDFTVATGAPGTDVTIGGIYPNLLLTIPRGSAGVSGALSDGSYGGIVVSGTGTVLNVAASHITYARLQNAASAGLVGATVPGVHSLISFATIKSNLSLVKGDVGLGNVDNTSDVNKPVSTATTAAISAAITANNNVAETRTIPVMAGAMYPRFTVGCGSSVAETTTNNVNYNTLDFDGATDEFAQFMIAMPKGWDEGTISVQFIWRSTGGTGSVVWGLQAAAISDDDVSDAAFGTAGTVTDTVTSTSDVMISSYTSAITIAGSPAAEDLVAFQVFRDANSGSDTSTVDAQLVGIRIKYTTGARDDS